MIDYDFLEQKRRERRISRRKLAQLSGIAPSTLQAAIERRSNSFNDEQIQRIAISLDVDSLEIVGVSRKLTVENDSLRIENKRLTDENNMLRNEIIILKARLYDLEHPGTQSGIDWSVFDMTTKGGEKNHGDNELVDGFGAERGDYAL